MLNKAIPNYRVIQNGQLKPKTPRNSDSIKYSSILLTARQSTKDKNQYQNIIKHQSNQIQSVKSNYHLLKCQYWQKVKQKQGIIQETDKNSIELKQQKYQNDIHKCLNIVHSIDSKYQPIQNVTFILQSGLFQFNPAKTYKSDNLNLSDHQFQKMLNLAIKQHQQLKQEFQQYKQKMQNNLRVIQRQCEQQINTFYRIISEQKQRDEMICAKMKELEQQIIEKDSLILSLLKKIKKDNIMYIINEEADQYQQ